MFGILNMLNQNKYVLNNYANCIMPGIILSLGGMAYIKTTRDAGKCCEKGGLKKSENE